MKMNYKRAVLVCLPHCGSTLFWSAFYYLVPLVLTDIYHLTTKQYSLVISLNNIVAIAVVPLFGQISDKLHTRLGRRTPLIILGTAGAVTGITSMGLIISHALKNGPAGSLVWFLVALFATMFFINLYRTPAYSLISDCFPKALHTKSNAVITIAAGLSGALLNQIVHYLLPFPNGYVLCFFSIATLMIFVSILYLLFTRENAFVDEAARNAVNLTSNASQQAAEGTSGSSRTLKFAITILTCFFIFMGYNAFNAHYSQFWTKYMMQDASFTMPSTYRTLLNLAFALPAAALSIKIGRSKATLAGLILSLVGYLGAYSLTPNNPNMIYFWFTLFATAYPIMSVNLNPMIVAFSDGRKNGKFTSMYLLVVTTAQVVTTMVSSEFIDRFGYRCILIYSSVCFAIALVACVMKISLEKKDIQAR